MGKKQDSLIGLIIICLIVIGMVAKFIEENLYLSLFILILIIGGVVVYFYNKNRENQSSPSVHCQYDEDEWEYENRETYNDYSPPPISQYWGDIDYAVPVDSKLSIEYTNGAGDNSKRDIDISHYDGSCHLRGYCHLRSEPRTFRIDRVKSCVDRDTGEVVSDIPAHLRRKYESSPDYILEELYKKEKDTLRSFYFVGKADGQLRKPEREIIHSVCNQLLKDHVVPIEAIDRMINNIDLPSMHAFKLAIGRLAKESPDKLSLVFKYATKIVNTQKTVHSNEQEALDYIMKKIPTKGST